MMYFPTKCRESFEIMGSVKELYAKNIVHEYREHNIAVNLVQQPKPPGCLHNMGTHTHTHFQEFSHEGPRSIMEFFPFIGYRAFGNLWKLFSQS